MHTYALAARCRTLFPSWAKAGAIPACTLGPRLKLSNSCEEPTWQVRLRLLHLHIQIFGSAESPRCRGRSIHITTKRNQACTIRTNLKQTPMSGLDVGPRTARICSRIFVPSEWRKRAEDANRGTIDSAHVHRRVPPPSGTTVLGSTHSGVALETGRDQPAPSSIDLVS